MPGASYTTWMRRRFEPEVQRLGYGLADLDRLAPWSSNAEAGAAVSRGVGR